MSETIERLDIITEKVHHLVMLNKALRQENNRLKAEKEQLKTNPLPTEPANTINDQEKTNIKETIGDYINKIDQLVAQLEN